jgi:hypothetical protein
MTAGCGEEGTVVGVPMLKLITILAALIPVILFVKNVVLQAVEGVAAGVFRIPQAGRLPGVGDPVPDRFRPALFTRPAGLFDVGLGLASVAVDPEADGNGDENGDQYAKSLRDRIDWSSMRQEPPFSG